MNLSDMKKKEPTTAWFDFSDGVRVQLVYIDPAAVRAIATECVKVVNGREEFDQDKALAKMAERILSWTGLTFGKVAELINIAVPSDMIDTEVPCVDENKIALLRDSWQFKPFVEQRTARLADFIAANREAEKKTLKPTATGPSPEGSPATSAGQ
jgi:hypothetical protein